MTRRPSTRLRSEMGDAKAPRSTTWRFLRHCSGPSPARSTHRAAPTGARVIVEKPFGRDARLGRGAGRDPAGGLPRAAHLPDRPLSRQGTGAEPDLLPVRQLVPRTDVEPQLHREHADHDGRGLRRCRPGRLLRLASVPSATSCRTTCCSSSRCSRWKRRPNEIPEAQRDAKAILFKSMRPDRPLGRRVRGQYAGFSDEPGVAPDLDAGSRTSRCG